MAQASTSSLSDLVDAKPLGAFQISMIVLCALVVLLDGFDMLVIGFVMPAVGAALTIPAASFGKIFAAGILGSMIGGLAFGPLADRYGRKWIIVACVLVFAAMSFATALAGSEIELVVLRFLTGLGLGGAAPVAVALVSEYCPKRIRATVVTLVWTSFATGGIVGGFASGRLVAAYGWPSLFYIGAIVPLVLAIVLAVFLQDSIFHIARSGRPERVKAALRRMQIDASAWQAEAAPGRTGATPSIRHLFGAGLGTRTLVLWALFFLNYGILSIFSVWSTSLLTMAGLPLALASAVGASSGLGVLLGTATVGMLIDRFGSKLTLGSAAALAMLAMAPIAFTVSSTPVLIACFVASGVFYGAGTAGALVLAGLIYPTDLRSTGIGVALASARAAQVLSPLLVGGVIAAGLASTHVFLLALLPGFLAVLAALVIGVGGRRGMSATRPA